MNFNLQDSFAVREKSILDMLEGGYPGISVITAAANLEWTLRRAIVALGVSPNKDLQKRLEKTSGLRKYAALWKKEVSVRHGQELEALIDDWDQFVDSTYQLRHRLVHGALTRTTRDYAKPRVDAILLATSKVLGYASSRGVDLHMRLPVRRKPWTPA